MVGQGDWSPSGHPSSFHPSGFDVCTIQRTKWKLEDYSYSRNMACNVRSNDLGDIFRWRSAAHDEDPGTICHHQFLEIGAPINMREREIRPKTSCSSIQWASYPLWTVIGSCSLTCFTSRPSDCILHLTDASFNQIKAIFLSRKQYCMPNRFHSWYDCSIIEKAIYYNGSDTQKPIYCDSLTSWNCRWPLKHSLQPTTKVQKKGRRLWIYLYAKYLKRVYVPLR